VATAKMAELAHVVGVDRPTPEAAAQAFIDWLTALKSDLAIPATLGAYVAARPVTRADIPALVEVAINDTCHQNNPRACTREDFERLFAAAI
jgi:alcohol dehydrogenase class IV